MATVYLARDVRHDRRVAIKVLRCVEKPGGSRNGAPTPAARAPRAPA